MDNLLCAPLTVLNGASVLRFAKLWTQSFEQILSLSKFSS